MQPNHMILFYVDDPMKSVPFYESVLGAKPIDASPGFAMFKLNDGTMLGLWNKRGVEPKPEGRSGSSELGFHVSSDAEVERLHKAWSTNGMNMVQSPSRMDFGYTFTGVDPDGNRLRVFAPA